jgi:penicillin amidase
MNRARTAEQFLDAQRDIELVQQNIVFADDKRIGMVAPGRVPVRDKRSDLLGLVPAPGWDARYDWIGWLPFESLPRDLEPGRGYVVTANHKILPPAYPHFITSEWYAPYRARRIEQLLSAQPRHDAAGMRHIQADITSLAAQEMIAVLGSLNLPDDVRNGAAGLVLERLRAWDGSMRADAPEPMLFHAWMRELRRRIWADELGPLARDFVEGDELTQPLLNVLQGRATARDWCDDVGTANHRETCAELAGESLLATVTRLATESGSDVLSLRWGDAHRAVMPHRPASNVPFLRRWFELSAPVSGDSNTINVGQLAMRDADSFATRHAATLRFVADLADARNDSWILGSGESGNPLSPHYGDQFPLWVRATALAIQPATGGGAAPNATLTLEPLSR